MADRFCRNEFHTQAFVQSCLFASKTLHEPTCNSPIVKEFALHELHPFCPTRAKKKPLPSPGMHWLV